MAKFFDPPQAKPLLPKEKIDGVYKSMRFKVFMGSFLAMPLIISCARTFRLHLQT